MKRCCKCRIVKGNTEFYRASAKKDGLQNSCKECSKASRIKFVDKNPNKIKKYRQIYESCGRDPYKAAANRKLQKAKRRAIIKNTDITAKFLRWLKKKTGDICPYCLELTNDWSLDHLIPLSKGGTHMQSNVIYCCISCNKIKGSKTPEEFAPVVSKILVGV